jgi:hypothetical protein
VAARGVAEAGLDTWGAKFGSPAVFVSHGDLFANADPIGGDARKNIQSSILLEEQHVPDEVHQVGVGPGFRHVAGAHLVKDWLPDTRQIAVSGYARPKSEMGTLRPFQLV